jgi:5-(carboxyamino)imidazole ribonucleotide mutase
MSKVAIIMGSKSDLPVMQEAIDILKGFDIETEVDIVSAHRTPEKLYDFSTYFFR